MKIYPENYELTFDVDMNNFKFSGKATILVVVKEKTKKIVLDSVELKIKSCKTLGKKTNPPFELNEKEETLAIKGVFNPGKHSIVIEFEGILNDKLIGFYRSRYEDNGKEKCLATTHFEPADARRAFPCFDNPAHKATFDISLIIDKNLTAISNTLPIEESVLKNNKKIVRFARTPKMSSYLVYLGVGEFEFLEKKFENILIRIATVPEKSKYGNFALGCAKNFLKFYQDYFDFSYPLPKLDIIAIPDFAAAAMENWGAITFRENAVLFYPDKSSLTTKQRIAEFVSHEIVHQWFGNLVTMEWWDDSWLNESFATYMAYKALDRYWPEWDVWAQYVLNETFGGMGLDALKSTHPIKVKITKTSEIDEIFDEISYDKGASVLRMIENYVGEETFMKGLRNYISHFQYKNAEAKDLWKELENASRKPVMKIMQKFITQPGVPVVKTELKDKKLKLSQKRFLLEENGKNFLWSIPLVIQLNGKILREVLDKNKKSISLPEKPKFINLNSNYSGFYISEYDSENLEALCKNITQNKDRLGIVHDLFYFVLSGRKDISEFLKMIKNHFLKEKDSAVGIYITGLLRTLYFFLGSKEIKELSINFSKNILNNLGLEPKENETPVDSILRSNALSFLAFFGDKQIINFAKEKFSQYLKDEKTLHPDMRTFVYSAAVLSDDSNYPLVSERYRKTDIQEEKAKLLSAMAKTKNKKLIKKTLEYSLTKEVRFAHIPYVISSACDNIHAKNILADWLMKNWRELVKISGKPAHSIIRSIIKNTVPYCGVGREKELGNFFKKQETSGLEKTLAQVFERLRINSRFVARYKGKIL